MLSVGFFSSINLGQGFMIGEKEATKLKIKEIHFNSLKNWLNVFDSYDFRHSVPDVPVFDSILHDFQSVLVYISTAVCYSITGLSFILDMKLHVIQ